MEKQHQTPLPLPRVEHGSNSEVQELRDKVARLEQEVDRLRGLLDNAGVYVPELIGTGVPNWPRPHY